MLFCYLDETEQKPLGVFAIGGYVFESEKLPLFEDQWQRMLKVYNLRKWHTTDWESSRGEYEGWSRQLRHDAFNAFYPIIRTTTDGAVSVVIDARAYYVLSDEGRAVLGGATIYPLAVRLCLGVVSNWLHSLGRQESIAFVLDRVGREGNKQQVQRSVWEAAKADDAARSIFSIDWRSSVETFELQSADILAYEIAKEEHTHSDDLNEGREKQCFDCSDRCRRPTTSTA